MDDADRATEQMERDQALFKRVPVAAIAGPCKCVRCLKGNDRADDGYAVCSTCMREAAA